MCGPLAVARLGVSGGSETIGTHIAVGQTKSTLGILVCCVVVKCPHCLETFREEKLDYALTSRHELSWVVCPGCNSPTVWIRTVAANVIRKPMVYPRAQARLALSAEVPEDIARDYAEACEVLAISAKASAALSRRILQRLLREYGGFRERTLETEIEKALPTLPSHLADAIDAVRHVGNIATHPIHSGTTGEIVDVEAGEADWLLSTVEALIDFYVVQPAVLAAKRAALNEKLADAQKPRLKGGVGDSATSVED